MLKTLVEIHGFLVPIQYRITEDFKIVWAMDNDEQKLPEVAVSLLEVLLRVYFKEHILQQLSDQVQAQTYEADARAAAFAENYP